MLSGVAFTPLLSRFPKFENKPLYDDVIKNSHPLPLPAGTYQYVSVDARIHPQINRGQLVQYTGNEYCVEPANFYNHLAGVCLANIDALADGWSLKDYPYRYFYILIKSGV